MSMKHDVNQSVLFLSYGTEKGQREFLEDCKEKHLNVRELRMFDVEVPIERYDEVVNWFKSIVTGISQRLIDAITGNMFIKPFIKKLEEKTSYRLMNIDWANKGWKHDYKARGKLALLTPIASEFKAGYRDNYCSTKTEKENYNKLYKFESKGYKPKTLKEQGIVEEDDKAWDMTECNKK